ncbi:MAG: hypothetical protein JWN56_981 [Sphingobacteriales bacterium]|nr:hypothetical protein [Sphingobacteriales bacterium]
MIKKEYVKFSRAIVKLMIVAFLMSFILPISAQTHYAKLPDFTFYRFDKTAFTKKQMSPGKISLFFFFDATCVHCEKSMQLLSSRQKDLQQLSIYLVSMDTKSAMEGFMKKFGKEMYGKNNVVPLMDLNYSVFPKFQPRYYPSIFLYSSKNELLYEEEGEIDKEAVFKAIKKIKKRESQR